MEFVSLLLTSSTGGSPSVKASTRCMYDFSDTYFPPWHGTSNKFVITSVVPLDLASLCMRTVRLKSQAERIKSQTEIGVETKHGVGVADASRVI